MRICRLLVPIVAAIAAACGAGSGARTVPDGGAHGDAGSSGGGADAAGSDAAADAAGGGSDDGAHDAQGTTGDGGTKTDASAAGDGGGPASTCKRGMASNTAPSTALAPTASSPGVAWWYDWASGLPSGASPVPGIAFVPMIWGGADLSASVPPGSSFLLGFNEPNFKAQSNLTPQQAAADWPQVEAIAKAAGIPVVSPAVNFCGSAANPSGCSDTTVTDPYTWLKDFLAACPGCEVDAVAVHWYNCDLPSLQAYVDGSVDAGGTLQGFVQFGKPIWVTELSCDSTHSVAEQKAYMQKAVPFLEADPHVARYAWFSASPIPNATLQDSNDTPTDLGATYAALAAACP